MHLFARRPSAGPGAQPFEVDDHVEREHACLPRLVEDELSTRRIDLAEAVHPSHVVHITHVRVSVFEGP